MQTRLSSTAECLAAHRCATAMNSSKGTSVADESAHIVKRFGMMQGLAAGMTILVSPASFEQGRSSEAGPTSARYGDAKSTTLAVLLSVCLGCC